MKQDWKKDEKRIYLPGPIPELIELPEFQYLTLAGACNPETVEFSRHVEALFSLAYTIKMSPKKNEAPAGYHEYSVYPLEGLWSIREEARHGTGPLNKDDLIFTLMIRQPSFVSPDYVQALCPAVAEKKKNELILNIRLENLTEGKCIQMLHKGSFESEPESFRLMEDFARQQGLERTGKDHKEIYLSDFRKTGKDALKTILRVQVRQGLV